MPLPCPDSFGVLMRRDAELAAQETIAPEKMGRAFSLLTLMGSLTMPIGLLISSPIAEQIGVRPWFLIAGIGMLVSVLVVSTVHCLSSPK